MSDKDYGATLNLPKTSFQMKANLPNKEPKFIKMWQEQEIYFKGIDKDKPSFILHDGPPYANGEIHIGHALNKICLLYTSPSPRDKRQSRMPSSA